MAAVVIRTAHQSASVRAGHFVSRQCCQISTLVAAPFRVERSASLKRMLWTSSAPDKQTYASNFRVILDNERTHRTSLRVEVVGAKELVSSGNSFWSICNPYCTLNMGATGAMTSSVDASNDPVWGEDFFFQHTQNPAAELHITVRDKQYFGSEELGRITVKMDTVQKGLRIVSGQGGKTWETYFVLKGEEASSEACRPGSTLTWFGHKRLGAGWDDDENHTSAKPPPASAFGMYGHRHVPPPRVRGRLYLSFSWVEQTTDTAGGHDPTGITVLPQPLPWPDGEQRKQRREEERAERERTWREHPNTAPFRILALDGGGVRGLLTAALLERLCVARPELLEEVDLVCGTSTGGLLALLTAAGYSAEHSKRLYRHHLPSIFFASPARRYSPFCATYRKEELHRVLEVYMEDRRLGDLDKHVFITSFKVDGRSEDVREGGETLLPHVGRWQPAVFSNIPKESGKVPPDNDLSCVEAAMRTSAAPTLFPLHDGYTDGAVFANNPSLVAVAKVKAHFPRWKLAHVRVLSLGTGSFPYNADLQGDENADWGIRQWGPHLLDILTDGSSVNVDMNVRLLLDQGYHRLDPQLPWRISIDNTEALDELLQVAADVDLQGTLDFLETKWST